MCTSHLNVAICKQNYLIINCNLPSLLWPTPGQVSVLSCLYYFLLLFLLSNFVLQHSFPHSTFCCVLQHISSNSRVYIYTYRQGFPYEFKLGLVINQIILRLYNTDRNLVQAMAKNSIPAQCCLFHARGYSLIMTNLCFKDSIFVSDMHQTCLPKSDVVIRHTPCRPILKVVCMHQAILVFCWFSVDALHREFRYQKYVAHLNMQT